MTLAERSTRIGRLRIRAAAEDPAAIGMRSESALRPLDLLPPGMPPHAILCIRSMADPLPGGIDVRSAHAPRATEWERVARGTVGDALRRAVPAASDRHAAAITGGEKDAAVLFADRAELLACAARDAVHARLASWYWKNILREATAGAALREWKREPMYVPAALEILATGSAPDDAVAFLRLIPPRDALELAAGVFPAIVTVTHALTPELPAWSAIVPEATHRGLSAEQRLLLGVALTLRRAPALARRASFAPAAAAWIAGQTAASVLKTAGMMSRPSGKHPTPEALNAIARGDSELATFDENRPRENRRTPAAGMRDIETPIGVAESAADMPPVAPSHHGSIARASGVGNPSPLLAPSTPTAFAGLFFFLNLFIVDDDCEIDPWAWLACLGLSLEPELEKDALWPVLTQLIGEPLDRAGDALVIPDLEVRLRERLPVDDPVSFLFRRFGRVSLTPAHIDIFFPLAGHPIEIRLSGLDRDPGWIRAAGRHVAFHFD